MSDNGFKKGVLFMLASGACLACVGFFAKLGQEIFTVPSLLFFRYMTAFCGFALYFFIVNGWSFRPFKGTFSNPLQISRGVVVLITQGCFFYYVHTHSLLGGMLLLNTGPLFVPLIERFILRRYVGLSTWVSVWISFAGVLCVLPPNKALFSWGSGIGLLAGLCQGISQILFGLYADRKKTQQDLFSFFLLCMLLGFIPYLFSEQTYVSEASFGFFTLFVILGVGISSIYNQYFRSLAFQQSTPGRLASFLYISILIAALLDWAVFHHVPKPLTVFGAALIITGGVLKIYLRKKIRSKKFLEGPI